MTHDPEPRSLLEGRRRVLALIGGVLLPSVTLTVESVSRICASVLFDPLPTPLHVLAAASVPAANLVVWLGLRRGRVRPLHPLLAGWALGVAAVYALFFLPALPLAVPGVLLFGLGLLPLTPLLAVAASLTLRRALRAAPGAAAPARLWPGAALALALLVAADLPRTATRMGLAWAVSEDAEVQQRGLWWLRRVGSERELLRRCYPRAGVSMDLLGVFWVWSRPTTPEETRDIYYRVTGRPFNAVARPWPARGPLQAWDGERAGETVGGRVRGLSLQSSRLDGSVDPDAALGYVEWTLELRNDTPRPQEARAQVLLPPGGVVSRVTLWIDGEEREAAFGARGVVREAYRRVVRRRRDPLLVTTAGPDRVLVQCFPVPARGVMKVRLGITAPLGLPAAERGELALPRLLEQNFETPATLRHAVWIEATRPLRGADPLATESPQPGLHTLRGALAEDRLADLVSVERDPGARLASAVDPFDAAMVVAQRLEPRPAAAAAPFVVVVDGSAGLAGEAAALARALDRPEVAALVVAGDGVEEGAAAELASRRWLGGTDNVPALARAWDLAAERPDAVVLWVHAPQPVRLQSAEPLRQRWERRPDGPRLLTLSVGRGPNRILEQLDGIAAIARLPRRGALSEDLERLFAEGPDSGWLARRERGPVDAAPAGAVTASRHLVRLWAREEVARRSATPAARAAATALAVQHGIVTPFTGGVVLENARQYEEAGLQPAAPEDVPTVPEPETWALLLVASALVAVLWRRRREGAGWTAA